MTNSTNQIDQRVEAFIELSKDKSMEWLAGRDAALAAVIEIGAGLGFGGDACDFAEWLREKMGKRA